MINDLKKYHYDEELSLCIDRKLEKIQNKEIFFEKINSVLSDFEKSSRSQGHTVSFT